MSSWMEITEYKEVLYDAEDQPIGHLCRGMLMFRPVKLILATEWGQALPPTRKPIYAEIVIYYLSRIEEEVCLIGELRRWSERPPTQVSLFDDWNFYDEEAE